MGASCCKVSKEKSLESGNRLEMSQLRNVRHSPQWGFRWDNRTHIEDIMDTSSPASYPDIANFNGSEMKRIPTPDRRVSSSGLHSAGKDKVNRSSITSSYQKEPSTSFQKSPSQSRKPTSPSTLTSISKSRSQQLDKTSSGKSPLSRNKSSRCSFSTGAQSTPFPSAYRSESLPSDSASVSSKSPLFQISRQASGDSSSHPASFNHDMNHWTFHTFTELVASSQRENPSFDEKCNFIRADTGRSNSDSCQVSSKAPICNICTKALKERSPHRLYSSNEVSAVAVLDCGHVFHADCLEKLTPDVSKYDPECPRCTYGAKDLNRLISNLGYEDKINKVPKKHVDKLKSHSMKGSYSKAPFLKRRLSEGESSRKKGFFARFRD